MLTNKYLMLMLTNQLAHSQLNDLSVRGLYIVRYAKCERYHATLYATRDSYAN